jgi:hypothetical protein
MMTEDILGLAIFVLLYPIYWIFVHRILDELLD